MFHWFYFFICLPIYLAHELGIEQKIVHEKIASVAFLKCWQWRLQGKPSQYSQMFFLLRSQIALKIYTGMKSRHQAYASMII